MLIEVPADHDLSLLGNANPLVDALIKKITEAIVSKGLDPYIIPTQTYIGIIHLYGRIEGLSSLKRSSDASLVFVDGKAHMSFEVELDNFKGVGDLKIDPFPAAEAEADINVVKVNLTGEGALSGPYALTAFTFDDIEHIDVYVRNLPWFISWFIDGILDAIANTFKYPIGHLLESKLKDLVNEVMGNFMAPHFDENGVPKVIKVQTNNYHKRVVFTRK
jgi:hypothetical protein